MSHTMFRGLLINGFDYDKQAWIVNAKYVRCAHPETMNCGCYGRMHEGEPVANILPSDALFIPEMLTLAVRP